MDLLFQIGNGLIIAASWVTAALVIHNGGHRSRGAVAWVIALIGLPWLALPMYWLSGQVRYPAYQRSQQRTREQLADEIASLRSGGDAIKDGDPRRQGERQALNTMAALGSHCGNAVELLADGQERLDVLIAACTEAQDYILLQTYQLADDKVGQAVADALTAAAARGCRVHVLYDEVGSAGLPQSFLSKLEDGGVVIHGFSERRRLLTRLRFNFRNHRKLVVIDGKLGFMGGMNLSEDYLDGGDEFSAWRDTQVQIKGPAVFALQLYFVEDWHFATKQAAAEQSAQEDSGFSARSLNWSEATPTEGDTQQVAVCGFGPHDVLFSGDVVLTLLIEAATERMRIATPYFVPDDRIVSSLLSAATRGVQIEVLVPRESDHWIFSRLHRQLAEELEPYGIAMWFYEPGFMHQKVLCIDDIYVAVGSANFDNRSLRLNFELLTVAGPGSFMQQMHAQLDEDFSKATLINEKEHGSKQWASQFLDKTLRLFAPVL